MEEGFRDHLKKQGRKDHAKSGFLGDYSILYLAKLLTSHFLMLFSETNLKRKEGQMQAYYTKCRRKVETRNPRAIRMKNKRPATQGVCPRCGSKVFRIGKYI